MTQSGWASFKGTISWMALAVVSSALLFLLFALLLWATDLSEQGNGWYALICCTMGCVIAGFGGGQIIGKRGLLWGGCYGAMFLLILFSLLFGITGGVYFPKILRPEWLLCIALSGLSGTFSVNLRKE